VSSYESSFLSFGSAKLAPARRINHRGRLRALQRVNARERPGIGRGWSTENRAHKRQPLAKRQGGAAGRSGRLKRHGRAALRRRAER
jgi:hypothetical protein